MIWTFTLYAQNSTSHTDNTNNITPYRTVSIGVAAGIDGNDATYIGCQAGKDNVASGNVFIGYKSGSSLVPTVPLNNYNNVAIGKQAGESSTGLFRNNLLLGIKAGSGMTNSYDNVMLGGVAGYSSEGHSNSFIGGNSGGSSTGNENTFFGYRSGESSIVNSSIAIGSHSANGSTGNENLYIGYKAGINHTGDNNIHIGVGSGNALNQTTGNDNVFIGNLVSIPHSNLDNILAIDNTNTQTPLIFGNFQTNKVGINTTNLATSVGGEDISNYSLYVEGGLLSDEVRVRTVWADYVFQEEYDLKSIPELDLFISENGHLPNCPSEEQVLEQGIEIGNITKVQQEKIEELTLYIIQQDKEFKSLRKEFNELKKILLSKAK